MSPSFGVYHFCSFFCLNFVIKEWKNVALIKEKELQTSVNFVNPDLCLFF